MGGHVGETIPTLVVLLAICAGSAHCFGIAPPKELDSLTVSANNMSFACLTAGPKSGTPVILLHGFPEYAKHWEPLMRDWESRGRDIFSVACDLRGYSPGASPDDPAAYDYRTMVNDVLLIADALEIGKFHLVGHDHGAGLGWFVAADDTWARDRLLSYAALSVPVPATFSTALFGPSADPLQQKAFAYSRHFAQVDSAAALFPLFQGRFPNEEALQKALWWYNANIPTYIAAPPVFDDADLGSDWPSEMADAYNLVVGVRSLLPLPADNGTAPVYKMLTKSHTNTLFVCGERDPYVLCTSPWALATADYIYDGYDFLNYSYSYASFDCAHSLVGTGAGACKDEATARAVYDTIGRHVESHRAFSYEALRDSADPAPAPAPTQVDAPTSSAAPKPSARDYPSSIVASEAHDYTIYYDDSSKEDVLYIAVVAKTEGWVGVGFSPNGGMFGSDIIIGWVDGEGNGHVSDRYSDARPNAEPTVDVLQDVTLVAARREGGYTVLEYSRPLATCDDRDMIISREISTYRLIWALGDGPVGYHGPAARGAVSARLFMPADRTEHETGERLEHIDLRMGGTLAITASTEYHCQAVKIPRRADKRHVTRIETIIDPAENVGRVHHIVLYDCGPLPEGTQLWEGRCDGNNGMPDVWEECQERRQIMAAWAVGGLPLTFPPEAGYPFPASEGDGTDRYMLVDIHYDNPARATFSDTSGVRVSTTVDLRPHDAGVLWAGAEVHPFHQLPPGKSEFLWEASCPSEATQAGLPEGGIHVFATLMHMHTAGRQIYVRHMRGGEEIAPLGAEPSYDFDFQDVKAWTPPIKIERGDSWTTQCVYDTSGRSKTTKMGEATDQEMCISFMMYYPAGETMVSCMEYNVPGFHMYLMAPPGYSGDDNDMIYYNPATSTVPAVSPYSDIRRSSAASCPAGCSPRCDPALGPFKCEADGTCSSSEGQPGATTPAPAPSTTLPPALSSTQGPVPSTPAPAPSSTLPPALSSTQAPLPSTSGARGQGGVPAVAWGVMGLLVLGGLL